MNTALRHRGPDADGFYIDDRIALGHRRLSIIDLSENANQPMRDADGRYWIVFNGEIYNFEEVKSKLSDYPFSTHGDTEVIIAAYIRWGPACLNLLKGMFAFAIWDKQELSLFIARDRLGVKPFYYTFTDDAFIFASEIRSIIATGLLPRKIDYTAIHEYLSFQSVTGRLAAVKSINELQAGCYACIKDHKIEIKQYWDITASKIDFDWKDKYAVHQKIRELLTQSVRQRLISDVPLGAFLSGGIDSSAVVALMAESGSGKPCTFNISFSEKSFDESIFALEVAKKYNTSHQQINLDPKALLEALPDALAAMDTPSGDGINTYLVSKAIKSNGISVALSGIGGDELFAGYPFFKTYQKLHQLQPLWKLSGLLRQLLAAFPRNSNKLERVKALMKADACNIRYFYPEFRRIFPPSQLQHFVRLETFENENGLESILHSLPKTLDKFPLFSQVSMAEYLGYTQYTLLKDTDQMSMAVSLEVREPFFDHELIEFVLSVPDHLKQPVYPKKLLVESLGGLLPESIVHRPKQGFLLPWSIWMKKELRTFCETQLKSIAGREMINGQALMAYWQKFLRNDPAVRWQELWLFVILGYWMDKNRLE